MDVSGRIAAEVATAGGVRDQTGRRGTRCAAGVYQEMEADMTHPEHDTQPRTADSQGPSGEPATVPGGYHSRGVPGEEGDLRKRMRVLKVGDRSQRINRSRPQTGGTGAEQGSAARLQKGVREAKWAAGARRDASQPDRAGDDSATAVYVIAKKGSDFLDTPVFHAGESGEEETVALFTSRERAKQYLDRAGWEQTDEVGELSPGDLLTRLKDADREGVRYVTANPDRDRHLAGHPQPVLSLGELGEESADSLSRQVAELARD